jgi:hypothetical protein
MGPTKWIYEQYNVTQGLNWNEDVNLTHYTVLKAIPTPEISLFNGAHFLKAC